MYLVFITFSFPWFSAYTHTHTLLTSGGVLTCTQVWCCTVNDRHLRPTTGGDMHVNTFPSNLNVYVCCDGKGQREVYVTKDQDQKYW